jgi:hypothetical protein
VKSSAWLKAVPTESLLAHPGRAVISRPVLALALPHPLSPVRQPWL